MLPKTILAAAVVVVALALVLVATGAQAQSADAILKQADQAGYAESTKIEMTQTVVSPSGDKRKFGMIAYSEDGNDKGLTEYLSPNQVRGMKILTLNDGDDIWVYFPRTNRVRKIASSARNRKVQGSDFTYDDMAMGKMATNWQGTVKGSEKIDGVDCHKLELKPTASGPKSYSKVIAWIGKADHVAHRIDYYDLDGDLIKRLIISGYKQVNGVLIPHKYTMTNLLDGGRTEMKIKKAEVNIRLSSSLFTEAGLGK
jgi:outer membrane lipoprotein-sorting protein